MEVLEIFIYVYLCATDGFMRIIRELGEDICRRIMYRADCRLSVSCYVSLH